MQGMSERRYAEHRGVSRGAVQKARTSGRLVLHADGSIDAAGTDAHWPSSTDPAMARGSVKPVPSAAVAGVRETPADAGQNQPPRPPAPVFAHRPGDRHKHHETENRLNKLHRSAPDPRITAPAHWSRGR